MTLGNPHKRVSGPTPPIQLSPRDHEALSYVRRYRFIRHKHLRANLFGNREDYAKRIKQLVASGYFIHPHAAQHLKDDGILPTEVIALGPKGRRLLVASGELETRRQQEKRTRSLYLKHTLQISDFMMKLEMSLPPDLKLIPEEDLKPLPQPWRVQVSWKTHSREVGIIPDALFGLEKGGERIVYALEMDRGTMPVVRSGLSATSYLRKLLAYQASFSSELTREGFGWSRFRVLTVTSSKERRDHILAMAKEVCAKGGGQGLFLAEDWKRVNQSPQLLNLSWQTILGKSESLSSVFQTLDIVCDEVSGPPKSSAE